ncbi:MAG: hypothetical protein NVS9B3_15960 [Gemmatimonadaceae bacterium]
MNPRISGLLAKLRERFATNASPGDVEAYLSSEGLDRRQIGEILSLLFPELAEAAGIPANATRTVGIRVLGPHEQGRFAPDAWGHLIAMLAAGAIDSGEMEQLVERALAQIDGRIGLDDLRSLVEAAGYDDAGPGGDQVTVH